MSVYLHVTFKALMFYKTLQMVRRENEMNQNEHLVNHAVNGNRRAEENKVDFSM